MRAAAFAASSGVRPPRTFLTSSTAVRVAWSRCEAARRSVEARLRSASAVRCDSSRRALSSRWRLAASMSDRRRSVSCSTARAVLSR